MNFDKLKDITAGKVKTTGVSAFSELELSKIYPNPNQPRKKFIDLDELGSSIKEYGLLQPIVVVKTADGYMIIAGERRYRASLLIGAKTIKAHIINVSEEQVEELTLIENIQRDDLTDFEIAKHIVKLWESGRYAKKSDLAAKIGKSDSYISKAFNCLKLDNEIIDHIEENKKEISISVLDEIARVKDKTIQKEVYEKYNSGEITRDEIKSFKEPKKKENFNETFYFSNKGWAYLFFRYINNEWIFKRLKDNENYELKIREVSTFTNILQDEESKISLVLDMTRNIKDAFKSQFDDFITKKCKLLEIGKYYDVTIKPKERFSTFEVDENFPRENLKRYELEVCCEDGILYQSDVIEATNSSIALKIAHQKYPNDLKEGYKFFVTEIEEKETKKEPVDNHTLERHDSKVFEVDENFPWENKDKNEIIEKIQKGRTYINKIVGFGKSIASSTNDQLILPIEDIGGFYLYNTGAGATKMFKEDVTYKLKIEEINPIFQNLEPIDFLSKENEKLVKEIEDLKKEIEELNNKDVFIVNYREKKGSAGGGGFRTRALNESEAIELGKKYYSIANDKNIIWEARTLKSYCNTENLSDYVSYGFGTQNDIGTYIALTKGDFEGTITLETNTDIIKNSNNTNYQVIIKEIDNPSN